MLEFLEELFFVAVTAAIPVLTAYIIVLIRKVGDNAAANAESTKAKTYITEATEAISAAVAATNQTYVDALKNAGKFDATRRGRRRKRRWLLAWRPSARRRSALSRPRMETSGNT